jgi:hypothetical protein
MISNPIVLIAVVLVSLTSLYNLISRDWRSSVGGLALQYAGVFLLVIISWPLEMAVAKMLAGWMAGVILWVAMTYVPDAWSDSEKSIKFGAIFRVLAALILALAVTSLVIQSEPWLSAISTSIRWGSFMLIGMGLLQLSLTSHPFKVIVGLLTALSGFEIIYAAIETSTLVTGLLAGVTLALALVGAYLLITPTMESAS